MLSKEPIYSIILSRFGARNVLSKSICGIVISLIPVVLAKLLETVKLIEFEDFWNNWLRLNFSGWIIGAFVFMNYIYHKSRDFYLDFIFLANNDKANIDIVNQSYESMFNSKTQNRFYISVGVLCSITGIMLGVNASGFTYFYIVFWSFWCGYVVGWGLWYTYALAKFMRRITSLNNLHLNPVYPSSSVGLFEISKIASSWSFCFFFEFLLIYAGLFFPSWTANKHWIRGVQMFWLSICLAVIVFNFIYPFVRINKLVSKVKRRSLMAVQELLGTSWSQIVSSKIKHKSEIVKDEVHYLSELHYLIRSRKNLPLNASIILKFISSVIVQALLLSSERPQILDKIYNYFFQ